MSMSFTWLFPDFFHVNQPNFKGFEIRATTRFETSLGTSQNGFLFYLSAQLFGFGFSLNITKESK